MKANALILLIFFILFFSSMGIMFQLSLDWPVVCLFSDLKSLITQKPADRSLPMWRSAFSITTAILLTTVCWISLRSHRKTGHVFLPVTGIVALLIALAFYPSLREAVLLATIRPEPTVIVIEAVDPESPRPVRLALGAPLSKIKWDLDVMRFGGAEACHVYLPNETVQSLVKSSKLLQLPSELAPDAGLAHDWLRLSIAPLHMELSVSGLVATGRHSERLVRTVRILLRGAYMSEVALPPCVDRLERILEPRK